MQIISYQRVYSFEGRNSLSLLWFVQHQHVYSTMQYTKVTAAPAPKALAT